MSVIVTDLPSLDWVRDVPKDISVRLIGTTAKHIKIALWSEAAQANVCLEYVPHENPTVAIEAAVLALQTRAATEELVREAQQKPCSLLVN